MDPHADYRVDPYSYLVIGEHGEYSISGKPQQIPLGFHIKLLPKLPGLRKFRVVRDGADTFDIVHVGTMMVQNSFAYISGQTLFCEEPYGYLTRVRFPPFASTFPCFLHGRTKEDVIANVMKENREKLIKIIEEELQDVTLDSVFDFDMTKRRVLYPPHPTCAACRAKLLVWEDSACPICDSERLQAEYAVREIEEICEGNTTVKSALEAARAAEREALMKFVCLAEEVEKINRKAECVAKQLEAAQAAAHAEEAELRKLKVQSHQWRKAAEVTASMLSVFGNMGNLVERIDVINGQNQIKSWI